MVNKAARVCQATSPQPRQSLTLLVAASSGCGSAVKVTHRLVGLLPAGGLPRILAAHRALGGRVGVPGTLAPTPHGHVSQSRSLCCRACRLHAETPERVEGQTGSGEGKSQR